MRHCLNPRNPHPNGDALAPDPLTANASSASLAESGSEQMQQFFPQQVGCSLCKYLLEGALLGDCRITRWIGSGAFGDVYEAEQLPPLKRHVAIKVVAAEHVASDTSAELFAREVQAIAALDHPNIMPVLRIGTLPDSRPYLVMKYAAHGSLQKYCEMPLRTFSPPTASTRIENEAVSNSTVSNQELGENPIDESAKQVVGSLKVAREENHRSDKTVELLEPQEENSEKSNSEAQPQTLPSLTPQQMLPLLESAATALQYAHDHGIIHLDVKPANLLLDGDDRLLLADFGVSTLLEGYTHASLNNYVGTPLYTPPEQWLEQPRAASDQYALAVTCYQLLTGRPPFTGSLYSIMHGHMQLPPPPLREFQPLIPAEIEAVILRGLAKEPANRYKDVQSFARAYRVALEHVASAQTDGTYRTQETLVRATAAEYEQDMADVVSSSLVTASVEEEKLTTTRSIQPLTLSQVKLVKTTSIVEDPLQETSGKKNSPPAKHRRRFAILMILLLFLLPGSALGTIWYINPCLLGICPSLTLSASSVKFLNGGTQTIRVANPGMAELHWHVSLQNSASWLIFAPAEGVLSPGQSATFIITASPQDRDNGEYNALIRVAGPGITSQFITVTMVVETGLNAVGVTANLVAFTVNQGNLQPIAQKITLTNKSGQQLQWWTTYSENTWLVVSPDQGTLKDGATVDLSVSANVQNLTPNTYLATLTLLGRLDQQSVPGVLGSGSFDIRLNVPQTLQTPTLTLSPTPALLFPDYNAQSAPSINDPATLRSGHAMVWDERDNLLLVFGGIDDQGNFLNDLWSYSTISGDWKQLSLQTPHKADTASCGTTPAPRVNAAMVWDTIHQQVLLYGGLGVNNQYFGDLWTFTPATGNWKLLQCTGNGPGERLTSAVWDGNQMLLLGGMNKSGMLADFWSYTPGSSKGWHQINAATPPGKRAYQALTWDAQDNRLFVFGGIDSRGVQQGDFWLYSISTDWMQITPASTANPLPRQQGMAVWDSTHQMLLMFGGWEDGQGSPFYGLWAFDPAQNAWKLLTPLDTIGHHIVPARTAAAMVWDATHQRAFIYAGAGDNKSTSSLNDLWIIV